MEPGEFVGLIGPAGAGKSTLIRAASGIIPKLFKGDFHGRVLHDGDDIAGRKPSELAGRIGTVFQDYEGQLFSTNVLRELAFGPENLGLDKAELKRRVKEAAELTGLSGFMDREPQSLSGGQKQRLALASVLCLEPRLLLGDEPTTDLDPVGREGVFRVLLEIVRQGRGVVLVEHDVERLLETDRLVALKNGETAAAGKPVELLSDPDKCSRLGVSCPQLFEVFHGLGLAHRPRNVKEALSVLHKEGFVPRTRAVQPTAPSMEAPVLTVDSVSFQYTRNQNLLNDINLEIRRGEFVAILGANGSGKTTLIKLFNGLLKPARGQVLSRGEDIRGFAPSKLGRLIGLVFQNPDQMLFAANVREEIAFGLRNQGLSPELIKERTRLALDFVGLSGREEADPFAMTKGDRQKIAAAAILASQPEVILMDEPTTGLDSAEKNSMMNLLKHLNNAGHTVVIITHSIELAAAYAKRTVLMKDGAILADGPSRDVLSQPDILGQTSLTAPPCLELARMFNLNALTPAELADGLTRGEQ